MSHFGINIKKIRSVRGLTQQQLADKLDITRGSISSYEEGRAEPKIETILKASEYFRIPMEQILTKKLTVNQLIGFKHPEKPTTLASKSNIISESLPDFSAFHESFIVIDTTKVLFESDSCALGQVLFGINTQEIKKGLHGFLKDKTWLIGAVEDSTDTHITVLGEAHAITTISQKAQIIGVYSPVQLHQGLLSRIEKLEEQHSMNRGR
ncbi:MAG: helix-turn-helix domain-containing protein [Schleiferiaceae bacterium]|nr:helix-turn-helix domain-containing protein [Schleiferiaceae bacterium]